MKHLHKRNILCSAITFFIASGPALSMQSTTSPTLEEVRVTAQKREQSLQDTPIAISVFSGKQLEKMGITSLDMINNGTVPSLSIMPMGAVSSTLIATIRGNGPTDTTQVTREGPVAFYNNGVYVGRPQGLSAEMLNVDRIEILRGPQGTLFGRNAVGGAINIISTKPTGEWGFKQLLGGGNYHAFRSATHVDLPEFLGVKTSLDYVHSERDGWIDNTAPDQPDYNEYDKNGGRVNLLWQANDNLSIDYAYDESDIESSQMYFQLYLGSNNFIDMEQGRQTQTRFPVETLNPSTVERVSNSIEISWTASEQLEIKSITSYSTLDENTNSNWAGTLNSYGFIFSEDIGQKQLTQELQAIGENEQLEWVAGMLFFKEDVFQDTHYFYSLQNDLTPITPATTIHPLFNIDTPTSFVTAKAESQAIFGQATWEAIPNKLDITLGARYTVDEKSGYRFRFISQYFDLESENFDTTFIINYQWADNLSSYIKRTTAYKAGGSSIRSTSFSPYENETVETWELGAKSEWLDQRIRLNTALFSSDYNDRQIDVADPSIPGLAETVNAVGMVEIDGIELDLELIPLDGLVLSLSYTYLEGDMPLQPNPIDDGALVTFEVPQTPQHAGALSADYTFPPMNIGTLNTHIDITSTDRYAYVPYLPELQRFDAYTLINARLTLSDINIGNSRNSLSLSLWGRNITDEEYIAFSFPSANAYGTPRTAGIELTYTL